jgi:glutamate dehydrogenase
MSMTDSSSVAQLLAATQNWAESHQIDPLIIPLVPRFYQHVAASDIDQRNPPELIDAVASQVSLAQERPIGTVAVRVRSASPQAYAMGAGRTVIEIVTDDMPFLVDSVSAALTADGYTIRLVIHPVVDVFRDASGQLLGVITSPETLRTGRADERIFSESPESWIHVELDDALGDPIVLETQLRRVLLDVAEAVEDWPRMRSRALQIANQLRDEPPRGVDQRSIFEAADLLEWMVDDHFTFIGYREYDLRGDLGEESLTAVAGTGLGVLRSDQPSQRAFAKLPAQVRSLARDPVPLVLTKANSRSTVHRRSYLDYVGVKRFDAQGVVIGEYRFLGLYSASAYTQSIRAIPVLRERADMVFEITHADPETHTGKAIEHILETYPRDEMFATSAEDLADIAVAVYQIAERRQTRLFCRRDPYGRYASCLVYLPRDRYNTTTRLRIQQILQEAYAASIIDHAAHVSDSVLARLHFVVRASSGEELGYPDMPETQQRIVAAVRSWDDDFADAVRQRLDSEQAARVIMRYADAFPEAYKEDAEPLTASQDVEVLESVHAADPIHVTMYAPSVEDATMMRAKIYRTEEPISLTSVLPILTSLGVDVIDERPYEIERVGADPAWIYDFGMRIPEGRIIEAETLEARFADSFLALWNGRAEIDALNALIVQSGLSWRQVSVLRAYTRYLRQSGATFGREHIERALLENAAIAASLIRLFELRFDPVDSVRIEGSRSQRIDRATESIIAALDAVASLDEDRILRALLSMISATLRTNHFRVDSTGTPREIVTMKLDASRIDVLPQPRPAFEVWAYSPRVEGVHLRFGPIARGGLRWSDRPADFRTEILGLVKAQQVKNAVIVPVGAKGGFVPKRLPDPTLDRAGWLREGQEAYTLFISGLLDITDNLVDGDVVPPPQVVCHDGDDPYLVVAADKGTATFSDLANSVAQDYRFWLGDAFASGGSAGYDHKAMGITARGAWESVKRHFRDLGVDTQAEDFTVVGIGDMSGDVFGNGMLLSRHIRLVAAFDHRHIFIDPTPDAAGSFAERLRLFELSRSSWGDYDPQLISPGGGVFRRTAKSVPITEPMRRALGIIGGPEALEPDQLIKAILMAPVDLLWNGGIGTYVKSQSQTNAEVGDKANDAVRINGGQLRVLVVGEGGNLGFTQAGRIEAAHAGVRLNTDAIDNSAGVDTSDHEVNIKILLDEIVHAGDLTDIQRNEVLSSMTDEVASLVLQDNYDQNVMLGNARQGAANLIEVHGRMIRDLESRGMLDRALEVLPPDDEIAMRAAAGQGLTNPELAVLAAYAKISLAADLGSSAADDPWFADRLLDYFPERIRRNFADRVDAHPLREGIITTMVVNETINHGGISIVFRACEETGASASEVVRAASAVTAIFDLRELWSRINALDNVAPTQAQVALHLESRRLLDRGIRWFLNARGGTLDVQAEVDRFGPVVRSLSPRVVPALRGVEHDRFEQGVNRFVELGAPTDLAERASSLLDVFALLDITEIADQAGENPEAVLDIYFALSQRYDVDRFLGQITVLNRSDRWTALARQALRSDLYTALAQFTLGVVTDTAATESTEQRIEQWETGHAEGLARARATLDHIAAQEHADLAMLSVALRVLRTLVTQSRRMS